MELSEMLVGPIFPCGHASDYASACIHELSRWVDGNSTAMVPAGGDTKGCWYTSWYCQQQLQNTVVVSRRDLQGVAASC